MNKQEQEDRAHTAISIIRGYLHDHGKRLRSEEVLKWAQVTGRRMSYEGIKYFADTPLLVLEEMVRVAVARSKRNQEKTTS